MNEEALIGLMRFWGWKVIIPRRDAVHGESRTYGQGCRCRSCKAGRAAKQLATKRAAGVQPKKRREFKVIDFDGPEYDPPAPPEDDDTPVPDIYSPTGVLQPHGHVRTYGKYGCRCRQCKEANNAKMREYRGHSVKEHVRPRHGTRTGYNLGCCCEPCMEANRVYKRDLQRLYAQGLTLTSDLDEYIFG
jgi:hypothetical protein